MPCGNYIAIIIIIVVRADPNPLIRCKMQKAVSLDCLRNKDQMNVQTVVRVVGEPVCEATPTEPIVVTMVPERYYKNWKSNAKGAIQRPFAIMFNEESSLIFVADSEANKLKLLDMHIPCNVIDVNLRLLDGAAFTNCRSMTLLGDFLVLLVTVREGQSGIVA